MNIEYRTRNVEVNGAPSVMRHSSCAFLRLLSTIHYPLSTIRSSRGSTLIIVLAILALIALLATTLSLTSRLEIQAARNFANSIQANMSAATGVTSALGAVSVLDGAVAPTQFWARPESKQLIRQTDSGALRSNSSEVKTNLETYDASKTFANKQADIRVEDESGKININAIGRSAAQQTRAVWQAQRAVSNTANAQRLPLNACALRGAPALADARDLDFSLALREILASSGLNPASADNLARDIIERRRGLARDPSSASRSTEAPLEAISDPRLPSNGDDHLYQRVEDLQRAPGMTPQIFNALRDRVTVFSCSADVIPRSDSQNSAPAKAPAQGSSVVIQSPLGNQSPLPKLEPKRAINTATAEEIEKHLLANFPNWTPLLARQFAANIVDARDGDSVPTRMPDINGQPVLGVEVTPCVNEVWPGTVTGGNDDSRHGRFVELWNPYSVTLSINGWTLRSGASIVRLTGSMVPRGLLVVTNDYSGSKGKNGGVQRSGRGSFYDVFGLVPNGSNKRLIEDPALDVSEGAGTVSLWDQKGNLIDSFAYSGGLFDGVKRSFQRDDPRVRTSQLFAPTPFAMNACYRPPEDIPSDDLFDKPEDRDKVFLSTGDLLTVFAGRAMRDLQPAAGGAGQSYSEWSVSWAWPKVKSENASEPDLRLLDVFCLDVPVAFQAGSVALPSSPSSSSSSSSNRSPFIELAGRNGRSGLSSSSSNAPTSAPEMLRIGRLNVNTAPREVLAAIPYDFADGSTLAGRIAKRRAELSQSLIQQRDGLGAPFAKLSDLFLDDAIFSDLTERQRLEAARRLVGVLTTESRSFRVTSCGIGGVGKEPKGAQRTVQAIVCRSDAAPRIVVWRYCTDQK